MLANVMIESLLMSGERELANVRRDSFLMPGVRAC